MESPVLFVEDEEEVQAQPMEDVVEQGRDRSGQDNVQPADPGEVLDAVIVIDNAPVPDAPIVIDENNEDIEDDTDSGDDTDRNVPNDTDHERGSESENPGTDAESVAGGDDEPRSRSNTPPPEREGADAGGATAAARCAAMSPEDFRAAKRPRVEEPADTAADDDAETCPICFEPWTNSGMHRLASLKCGHLFGQSCIERWLKGQGGKCPHCNAKAKKQDIRVIYAKALKTTDTSERDRALKDLEKERESRRKIEMDAAQNRLQYQLVLGECNKLKRDLSQCRQELAIYRSNPALASASSAGSSSAGGSGAAGGHLAAKYVLEKTIKVFEGGGCRVMAYSDRLATLVISQPSASPLFPGFGVKKVNTLDFRTTQYVSIHSKAIRDLAFNPDNPDGLLLSCSLDKTVKMTSLLSNTVVQTYNTALGVWACAWNTDDNNYFYAGLQNGRVLVFDVRDTSNHVKELNTEGSRAPISGLCYVPRNPQSLFRPGGVLIGQLDRAVFYEATAQNDYKLHCLPLEGNLTCLSYENSTRHILASFRPSPKHPCTTHEMFELTATNASADPAVVENLCSCNSVQSFRGGKIQKLMSRSSLFSHPQGSNRLLCCSGDEHSLCAHIWDVGSGNVVQKLQANGAVIDVCSFQLNQSNYLATLTDKQVFFYKWT